MSTDTQHMQLDFIGQKEYIDKLLKENNPVNNIDYKNNKIFKNVV